MYTVSWRKIEASECTDESEEDVEPTGNPV